MTWGDECRYCYHKGKGCTHNPHLAIVPEDDADLITVEYLVDQRDVYRFENLRMMKRIDELIKRIQDLAK